jgi:hypothetical protein
VLHRWRTTIGVAVKSILGGEVHGQPEDIESNKECKFRPETAHSVKGKSVKEAL